MEYTGSCAGISWVTYVPKPCYRVLEVFLLPTIAYQLRYKCWTGSNHISSCKIYPIICVLFMSFMSSETLYDFSGSTGAKPENVPLLFSNIFTTGKECCGWLSGSLPQVCDKFNVRCFCKKFNSLPFNPSYFCAVCWSSSHKSRTQPLDSGLYAPVKSCRTQCAHKIPSRKNCLQLPMRETECVILCKEMLSASWIHGYLRVWVSICLGRPTGGFRHSADMKPEHVVRLNFTSSYRGMKQVNTPQPTLKTNWMCLRVVKVQTLCFLPASSLWVDCSKMSNLAQKLWHWNLWFPWGDIFLRMYVDTYGLAINCSLRNNSGTFPSGFRQMPWYIVCRCWIQSL